MLAAACARAAAAIASATSSSRRRRDGLPPRRAGQALPASRGPCSSTAIAAATCPTRCAARVDKIEFLGAYLPASDVDVPIARRSRCSVYFSLNQLHELGMREGGARCRSRCAPSACACSAAADRRARDAPIAAAAPPSRAARCTGDAIAWPRTAACCCCCAGAVRVPALPLATIFVKSVAGQATAHSSASPISPRTSQTPALLQSVWQHVWVRVLVDADHGAAGVRASPMRSRAAACRSRALFRNIALMPLLAPSLLAAISFIYWFGNQGALQGVLPWLGLDHDLRRARHRARRCLRGVSARADDPDRRAVAGRRAAVRSGRCARHVDVAQVLHDHAARRASTA